MTKASFKTLLFHKDLWSMKLGYVTVNFVTCIVNEVLKEEVSKLLLKSGLLGMSDNEKTQELTLILH